MDPENFRVVKNYRKFFGNILVTYVPCRRCFRCYREAQIIKILIVDFIDLWFQRGVACEAHLAVLYFTDDI